MSNENTQNMLNIQKIEELSMNAWPSYKIELYDKWLIRFSHQYTFRTNCVEQVGESGLPIEEKVSYCEDIYKNYGTPCNFKISPIVEPSFDSFLEDRGYGIRHETEVMTMSLDNYTTLSPKASEYGNTDHNSGLPELVRYDDTTSVSVNDTITDRWITELFRLNHTTNPIHLKIVPSMFKAIPKTTIVAAISDDRRMVASGLGILDRDYLGIYAIYIDPEFRRRHYASYICNTLITQGIKMGARYSYLQVVKGNEPAISLYERLGFRYHYSYWFRSKPTS